MESDKITGEDKDLIFRFQNECYSQSLSHTRVVFYLDKLKHVCLRWSSVPLHEMDKDSVKETIARIERDGWHQHKKRKDDNTESEKIRYSEHTKQGYKVTIKKFFQWAKGNEWKSKKYPDMVDWIRTSVPHNHKRLPEEILTQEDVFKMINSSSNIRNKALISSLYESGCRIGELLPLKLKNLEFDNYGAVIHVHGKTGSRRIRLITSVPHLANWVNNHPNKDNPESEIWVSVGTRNNSKMISYHLVLKILRKVAKKSGVEKAINPHMFRHSRATYLANKLTEAQMKEFFGWTQGSEMASVYVHLSGRDVDSAILKIHGKLLEEKTEDKLTLKKCPRCYQENSSDVDFCYRCHLPLNEKTALELQSKEKQLLSMITPEMIEGMIEKKVNELLKAHQ